MSELYDLLEDSQPTYQRVFRGTQRKFKKLAKADGRTVPHYLANLADKEYAKRYPKEQNNGN